MIRYFVDEDGYGELWVWRDHGIWPQPVLSKHQLRDDLDLWDAIVALVEGG